MSTTHEAGHPGGKWAFLALALGALGVVYGDIGTSPLYTINEINKHAHLQGHAEAVFGAVGLIFWSLVILISFKYALIIMSADYKGEGGTFALSALLRQKQTRITASVAGTLLVLASCLLLADGALTPAISVLSAIEGLNVTSPDIKQVEVTKVYVEQALLALIILWSIIRLRNQTQVVSAARDIFLGFAVIAMVGFGVSSTIRLTLLVFILLFSAQSSGTESIGKVFGPVMVVWFGAIAALGIVQILKAPAILSALNPYYAWKFLQHGDLKSKAIILGSVTLAFTGGEALYADMGHFGKQPIRLAWYMIAFPALILNYLGQGARLLDLKTIEGGNVFFDIVPAFGKYGMVALATVATIIASQALISGAFSICRSGINLGLLPKMEVRHTSSDMEGQIYLPAVNWILFVACSLLVIGFKESGNLASAYGLAVTTVMLLTAFSGMLVAIYVWRFSVVYAVAIFSPLLVIDLAFFSANSYKFVDGGWITVLMGLSIFALMRVWEMFRYKMGKAYALAKSASIHQLLLMREGVTELKIAVVVLTKRPILSLDDGIPPVLAKYWQSNLALPRHITFFTVREHDDKAEVVESDRYQVTEFDTDESSPYGTIKSVVLNIGWKEQANIRQALLYLKQEGKIKVHAHKWLVLVGTERFISVHGFINQITFALYRFIRFCAQDAELYYGLEADAGVIHIDVPMGLEASGRVKVLTAPTETFEPDSLTD